MPGGRKKRTDASTATSYHAHCRDFWRELNSAPDRLRYKYPPIRSSEDKIPPIKSVMSRFDGRHNLVGDTTYLTQEMVATKPSKKQRGKLKAAKTKKETAKTHVKFDDDGEKVVPKKRARMFKKKNAEEEKEGGGKADRSPEMIQQAKYYLEQWQKRDEPKNDDELPWKFKKIKQQWILRWMYEADVVPKSMFSVVLEYLNGIQGAARQRVMESAQEIIDVGVPAKEEEEAAAEEKEKLLSIKLARRRYKRALQMAELLA